MFFRFFTKKKSAKALTRDFELYLDQVLYSVDSIGKKIENLDEKISAIQTQLKDLGFYLSELETEIDLIIANDKSKKEGVAQILEKLKEIVS